MDSDKSQEGEAKGGSKVIIKVDFKIVEFINLNWA
jgi:hypothetical protein